MVKKSPHTLQETAPAARPDRKFVTALARGLQILGEFEADVGLGNQELAQRTGLPPATVTRLTHTLTTLGYLRHLPDGKYCTGAGFLGLSAAVQRTLGVQRIARPYMEALAMELNCTVAMGTRDRNSMIFLEVVRPNRAGLIFNTDVGSALPIHTTAIGMAYLVATPLAERAELLGLLQEEYAGERDEVRKAVEEAHQSHRRDGFVIRVGSWHRDINGVGVPLKLDSLPNVYSFICTGSSRSMSRKVLREVHGPKLREMVAAVRTHMLSERPRKLPKPRLVR